MENVASDIKGKVSDAGEDIKQKLAETAAYVKARVIEKVKPTNRQKWLISLYSAILFLIIASPFAFKLVNGLSMSLFGVETADNEGCPNTVGLLVHTVVFLLIVRAIMQIKLPGLEERFTAYGH